MPDGDATVVTEETTIIGEATEEVVETKEEETTTPTEETTEEVTEEGKASGEEEGQGTEETKEADSKADDEKSDGAPEEYEEFKIPEGMEFDKERAEKFGEVAKSLELDQEGAQKLVDLYSEAVKETAQAQADFWADTQAEWRKAAETDPEFGGAKFKENVATAKRALNHFGDNELSELADSYGIGNHPAFIRLLYNVGKAMSEDNFAVGGAAGTQPDPAKVLFPDQN